MPSGGIKVLGVGAPILDILVRVDDSFVASVGGGKGGMAMVDSKTLDSILAKAGGRFSKATGGSAGNTVFSLAKLGVPTAFLGKIGMDSDGDYYKGSYEAMGGDASRFKLTDKAHTGRCLSMITPDSERTMRTDLGAAGAFSPEELAPADFEGVSHVHVEGYLMYSHAVFLRVLELAKGAACAISLDLASFDVVKHNRDKLPEILRKYVDVVFANEDEAREFCRGPFSPEDAANALGSLCPVAAVKLGKDGSCIKTASGTARVPANLVKAVDTTGAGDLWQAGFLYGWLRNLPPETCGRYGSILGAEVVQVVGASIPSERWAKIRTELK